MKIIKPGSGQHGWSTKCECTGSGNGGGGCGAILLVEEPDIFQTSSSCRDETDYYYTFACTACGVWTDLRSVPHHVRVEAAKRHRTP